MLGAANLKFTYQCEISSIELHPLLILKVKTGEADFPQQKLNVQMMPKGPLYSWL